MPIKRSEQPIIVPFNDTVTESIVAVLVMKLSSNELTTSKKLPIVADLVTFCNAVIPPSSVCQVTLPVSVVQLSTTLSPGHGMIPGLGSV